MTIDSAPVRVDKILPHVSKPARYTGGEWNSILKDWDADLIRVALAFPDTYEIGSSHLGLQILYELLNQRHDVAAERVFAPWIDMEAQLAQAALPLFALESRRPLAAFDIIGFTLPYELTFSNVLNMLFLASIPLRARERDDTHPIVLAGGSGVFNPEPISDFVDLFAVGDGEEVIHDIVDAVRDSEWRPRYAAKGRRQRESFLRDAANIPGVYVPSLYESQLTSDGCRVRPATDGPPSRVSKRYVSALPFAPVKPVVPFVQAVHDRAAVEIMRGCTRGCRFCQAGIIYRTVRERPLKETVALVDQLLDNTGYEEIGMVSLSSADHSEIDALVAEIARRHPEVNISLPSLRVDTFSVDLARSIHRRKSGFTFAPEAGSQRMRDVINKHVTAEDTLRAAAAAFAEGWSLLKLYFMIGLPGETLDDVEGIARLARELLGIGRRHHGGRAQLHVSVNTFSPKPHTPFQWIAQDSEDSLRAKQEVLRRELRGIKLGWSDNRVSFLETALARGDRRLGSVIHEAWQSGARFDAWGDQFQFQRWSDAFDRAGISMSDFTHRGFPLDDPLPWDHIDSGVSRSYLKKEYQRALLGQFTPDCHIHGECSACGYFRFDDKCLEAVRRDKMAAHV